MEANQDNQNTISDPIDQSASFLPAQESNDERGNKENQPSDKSLLDMIKSRPRRANRKVPSRLKPKGLLNQRSEIDESKPGTSNQSDEKSDEQSSQSTVSLFDSGLDTFFQSTSVTLKKRTFGNVYPKDETSTRSSLLNSLKCNKIYNQNQSKLKKDQDDDDNNRSSDRNKNGNTLCPMSIADKIARSRSSPNLIDPRKMLLPGDPRVNLSIIKELRSRKKSEESVGESTVNTNNLNNQSSLLLELKAKNKSFCSKKDAHGLVNKPPISTLKPVITTCSPSTTSPAASSTAPTVHQSGQFFNVKLRKIKSSNRPVNSLVKSFTRASFPGEDKIEKMKRNSEPNSCKDNKEDDDDQNERDVHVDGDDAGNDDDKRLSEEASALDVGDKDEKNHRSSAESSSSSSSGEEEEDEKKDDDNCHKKGISKLSGCPDDR